MKNPILQRHLQPLSGNRGAAPTLLDARVGLGTLSLCAALSLGGCASASSMPNLEARFGESVIAARAQQTINLQASSNTDPVSGIDGRAARDTMGRYHESFKSPPPTFSVINIGGSIAGSSGGGQ